MCKPTVDGIIGKLERFFNDAGGTAIEPDNNTPMGAATFHTEGTFLPCFSNKPEFLHFRQVCIRPFDDMNDVDPSRNNVFMQYQCIVKPAVITIEGIEYRASDCALKALSALGITKKSHLIELINDDWKSPSMGAFGVGWEIRVNGLEVMQVTYIYKMGDCDLEEKVIELTFGIDRIAMIIQDKKSIMDLDWDDDSHILKEYDDAKVKFVNPYMPRNVKPDSLRIIMKCRL